MKTRPLLEHWQALARSPEPRTTLAVELTHHDLARLRALTDMYPGCPMNDILADLVRVALDDLQEAFPFVHGPRQVGEDEFGNPLYEDIGPTPRFLALTREHLKALEGDRPGMPSVPPTRQSAEGV